jgi:two-component system nitrate/nitrite response regulator NarP
VGLLTARELDVLRELAGGNRNRDIAIKLFISEETVKIPVKHIMEKVAGWVSFFARSIISAECRR